VDALVFSQQAKYLYIGRDGRDIVWSLYNHHARANAEWYAALNDTPGRVGPRIDPPPESPATYFRQWLAQDGFPFWPFWENVRSWWEIRALPNVLLMHFNEMKADLPAAVDQIADFLDIDLDEETRSKVIAHSSFDHMKRHADRVAPLGGAMWEGGAQTFIHRGTNERWRDVLTREDIAAYDAKARAELGEACAHWLASGQRLD
jgi:aryl sulfotransferase